MSDRNTWDKNALQTGATKKSKHKHKQNCQTKEHKKPEVVARMHDRHEKEKRKQITRECMTDQKNSRRNNASETGAT